MLKKKQKKQFKWNLIKYKMHVMQFYWLIMIFYCDPLIWIFLNSFI